MGTCLEGVLREQGYHATMVESYGRFSDVIQILTRIKVDLVIATNTSLTPAHILRIVPEIKARHPSVRIMVLSGYHPDDFVAFLKQKGTDGFLPLPFEEDALLQKVAGLLSNSTP